MRQTMMDEIRALLQSGIDPTEHTERLVAAYGRLCAVLVLDSTGFTKTTREVGIIRSLSRLAQMRAVMVPILEENGCFHYITEADSFIALFPSVPQAMAAVEQGNRAMANKDFVYPNEEAFEICCGIGYGTLLITGDHGEFFGPEMNFASKLGEDTAEARELLLTPAAYQELPPEKQQMFSQTRNTISKNDLTYYITTL